MTKKRQVSKGARSRRASGYGSVIKTDEDLTAAARRLIRSATGSTPPMSAVRAQFTDARSRELSLRNEIDALVVLAKQTGLTWNQLGDYLGTTRQGATKRYDAAERRIRERAGERV